MVASLSPIRNAFCRCDELLINYWNAAGRPLGFKMSYLPKWHMWPFNTEVTIQSFLPPADLRGIRDEPLNVEWQQSDVKSLMTTASLDDRRPKTSRDSRLQILENQNVCIRTQACYPANTRHRPNVGPLLGHRLRRWPNTGPTLGRRLVFAGIVFLDGLRRNPERRLKGGGAVISNGS